MKTKLFKAYKFHNDVILGSYIGAIAFVLMALYEYYSYVHLGAKANSFFDVSSFSSIFFPGMMMTFLKEKKNLLMAHGFTRKKIFISQQFSMLSIIPFLSIIVIIVEKIYYQANEYKPFIQVLYKQYFKANNIQQWGAIAFTILWVATNIILMFAILYVIVEIASILGKKG